MSNLYEGGVKNAASNGSSPNFSALSPVSYDRKDEERCLANSSFTHASLSSSVYQEKSS